jgi:hypothetical protein
MSPEQWEVYWASLTDAEREQETQMMVDYAATEGERMTDQPAYRSASYLAEPHPQVHPGNVRAVLENLYVTFDCCPKCGALVLDTQLHDEWHAEEPYRLHAGML